MAYVRVSPGKYKDTKTGKIINSVANPNRPIPKPTGPVGKTNTQAGGGNAGGNAGGGQSISQEIDSLIQAALGGLNPNFDPRTGLPERKYKDLTGLDQDVYNAEYGALTQHTQEDQDRAYAQKSEELIQRGIPVGSDLYEKEMKRLEQGFNDIRANAALQAKGSAKNAYLAAAGVENQQIESQYQMNLGAQQEQDSIRNQLIAAREAIASGKLNAKQLAIEKEKVKILAQQAARSNQSAPVDNSAIINAGTNAP